MNKKNTIAKKIILSIIGVSFVFALTTTGICYSSIDHILPGARDLTHCYDFVLSSFGFIQPNLNDDRTTGIAALFVLVFIVMLFYGLFLSYKKIIHHF